MRVSLLAILTLVLAVLVLSFLQFQVAQADTAPFASKALTYVRNVLPFDISHYVFVVDSVYSLPSAPNDPTITQVVAVELKSNDSTIHVVCVYVNCSLHQCGVTPTGTPISDRPYTSVRNIAARILQAHQEQTGLDSTALLKTLSLLNDTQATNVALGDINLSVSQFPDIVGLQTIDGIPVPVQSNSSFSLTFDWTYMLNGVQGSLFTLSFDKGTFYNLQDERAIHTVANTDNIGNEEPASTPIPNPIAAAQQNNSTSLKTAPQPTNDTLLQTKQYMDQSTAAQKNAGYQNALAVPLLIGAISAYITVLIIILTYKSKKTRNKS